MLTLQVNQVGDQNQTYLIALRFDPPRNRHDVSGRWQTKRLATVVRLNGANGSNPGFVLSRKESWMLNILVKLSPSFYLLYIWQQ